ncbi:MAG: hypothetical protein RJB11_2395 [Planctomycetota bacterium]
MNQTLRKIASLLSSNALTERKSKQRALRVEALENRELFAVAPLAPLGSKSTLLSYSPLNVTRIASGTTTTQAAALASPSYRIFVSQGTIYTTENGGSLY